MGRRQLQLSDEAGAERIDGARVTHELASVLRVRPLVGRMFSADEDKPGAPEVVVIGEGLWRERFGARESVIGETLRLNGVSHTIVGVMPSAAAFPRNIRLWVPFRGNPTQDYQSYGSDGAIARLKPGITPDAATKDLLRAQQPIWDARDRDRIVSPFVRPLREQFARDFRTQASTLQVAVAILLIVACVNVASVMLARAIARKREMGIRLAIGASRSRLARQLFLENVLLAAAGGAIGLILGRWALDLLLSTAGDQVPQWADFSLDGRVVAFTVLLSGATAVLFGWAPALHAIVAACAERCTTSVRARRRAREDGERSVRSSARSSRSRRCCWWPRGCCCARTTACATSTRASTCRTCSRLPSRCRRSSTGVATEPRRSRSGTGSPRHWNHSPAWKLRGW